MPNELTIITGTTGQTLTAQLSQGTVDVGSLISLLERPASSSRYTGDVPVGLAAGIYDVRFLNGTVVVGSGRLAWDGTAEITGTPLEIYNYFTTASRQITFRNTSAEIQSALTSQGLTSTRASNLDFLDAPISSRLATLSYIPPTLPPLPVEIAIAVESQLSNDFKQVKNLVIAGL